jgi:phosphoglycolate phosphatase-like HAD superfamily hydrolase
MLKAIIFDIDGTLVDSVDLHARAWQETFRHFGREVEFEKVRYQIGKGGDQLMPVFFSKEELERFGEEMEAYRGELFKSKYLPQVRAFPQVRELFERVKADGKRIALASSAKKDELKVYKELARITDLVEEETSAELRAAGCTDIYRDPADLLARYDNSPLAQSSAKAGTSNHEQ